MGKAGMKAVRQGLITFALGEGEYNGRQLNLNDAGLGMRDFRTGTPLLLSSDKSIRKQLIAGWTAGDAK
jgi:hypothetical protein